MAAHSRVRLPPIPDSASFLLISRSARFHEFHEPLRMRRQRSEVSNANGVARKSPPLGERNDPNFHRLLRLRAAISSNAAKQMPLSTIRHMASNPLRRMRTFNHRPVRAAAATSHTHSSSKFSRSVLPEYLVLNRSRRCSSGTTRSTNSSKHPGV